MIDKRTTIKLLRGIIHSIDGLDDKEFEQLLSGKGKLVFSQVSRPKASNDGLSFDSNEVLERLNGVQDRAQAKEILAAIAGRDALASLAKALKVHVIKHDRREDIESKIIEFVIGGRLRTEAIRSLNLRGPSRKPED